MRFAATLIHAMTYEAFKITCMKFASKFDVKNARFCYEQVGC